MKILGITGGVGSGKSVVLYELEKNYDAYIVEADKLAHTLMEPGQPIYNRLIECFGKEILCKDTPYFIDRKKLGDIVFNDKEKLSMLDSITHPLVKASILEQIKEQRDRNTSLFVIEAALLIQDGYKEICDEIWYIYVDKETRIKRLMKQRGYTVEKCEAIFASQETDEYYKINSDCTINNENDYEITAKQIKVQLNKLL